MAEVLGGDDARMTEEIEAYRSRVDAERASQQRADDGSAEIARLTARDTRDTPVPTLADRPRAS